METRVILDTTAYCETNYGRSSKFSSLLDLLKKSNAHLVLLPSVLEEVLAKHERDFKKHVEIAKNSVKDARKYCFTGKEPILLRDDPDFAEEREALKRSLCDAGKWVTVECPDQCFGVDILEVARRGARRIPPANTNGEELRDVIHWLSVLSYAKHNDSRILFVSRDNGFWAQAGGLKEEILQDVKATGKQIELFRDIDELLKRHSISSEPLDPRRATVLFDITKAASTIVEIFGDSINLTEVSDSVLEFKSGQITSSEFQTGTVYRVSTDAEFIEATFIVNIASQVEFTRKKASPWDSVASVLGGTAQPSFLGSVASDVLPYRLIRLH